jgi:uncharacterized protein (DUF2267 family)
MTTTGLPAFDATVEKTNHVLHSVEEAYGWPRDHRPQSYDAVRAVLHTLRDRLNVQEASDLAAQLPMLLRGVYYEGWKPAKVPVKMHRAEFLDRVRAEYRHPVDGDGGVELLVQIVLDALRLHITEGEWRDVQSTLPGDLVELLR